MLLKWIFKSYIKKLSMRATTMTRVMPSAYFSKNSKVSNPLKIAMIVMDIMMHEVSISSLKTVSAPKPVKTKAERMRKYKPTETT